MTRINVGIHPVELPSKLLLAEHREIKRIPNTIKSGKAIFKNIPETFRLGAGHVKFFYTRIKYLRDRYDSIYKECKGRSMNVMDYSSCFEDLPDIAYSKEYFPNSLDRQMIIDRIRERGFELLRVECDVCTT
jgi:hypothetical protein